MMNAAARRGLSLAALRLRLIARPANLATIHSHRRMGWSAACNARHNENRSNSGFAAAAMTAAAVVSGIAVVNAEAAATELELLLGETELPDLTAIESATGVSFPVALSPTEQLAGTGVRLMGGIVQVYALGMYVDPKCLRKLFSSYAETSAEQLMEEKEFWDTLCSANAPLERTLRMVVVREVAGKHMQHGFERGLLPRIRRASNKSSISLAKGKAALKDFTKIFVDVGTMKVGSDVRIALRDGKRLDIEIDGRAVGSVKNEALTWALLDMFLGDKPVAPTLKSAVSSGVSRVLNS